MWSDGKLQQRDGNYKNESNGNDTFFKKVLNQRWRITWMSSAKRRFNKFEDKTIEVTQSKTRREKYIREHPRLYELINSSKMCVVVFP